MSIKDLARQARELARLAGQSDAALAYALRLAQTACDTAGEEIAHLEDTQRKFGAVQHELQGKIEALEAALNDVLPYALSRAEDLEEAKEAGNEDPNFPGADACWEKVRRAMALLPEQWGDCL